MAPRWQALMARWRASMARCRGAQTGPWRQHVQPAPGSHQNGTVVACRRQPWRVPAHGRLLGIASGGQKKQKHIPWTVVRDPLAMGAICVVRPFELVAATTKSALKLGLGQKAKLFAHASIHLLNHMPYYRAHAYSETHIRPRTSGTDHRASDPLPVKRQHPSSPTKEY